MKHKMAIFVLVFLNFLSACDDKVEQEDVIQYFQHHKIGGSDYAIVKRNAAGDAYLAIIFGMADDRASCEELIAPYNKQPELSVLPGEYRCEKLN